MNNDRDEWTKGWVKCGVWHKEIDGVKWYVGIGDDGWNLYVHDKPIATRATLRECQILAHETARLWAGEGE